MYSTTSTSSASTSIFNILRIANSVTVMLRVVFLVLVFQGINSEDICERPRQLTDNESKCLSETTTFFERVTYKATEALNLAKKKLGVDVDEEPLKCGYYLCILHYIEMVSEAGVLDPAAIKKWITQNVGKDIADEFNNYVEECLESLSVLDKMVERTNCQKAQEFTKCISQYQRCPIFRFP